MPLSIGNVLRERYRVDGFLAKGGMGAVYKAWDISLDVPIAIKENIITSDQARKQFEREARILARLHHPNLPRVTNHFVIADHEQYLVMDLVEGDSLAALLSQGQRSISSEQALAWIRQVCDALNYLHSQVPPIIHRDIKPQNIIITGAGKAILVDFGIAKIYDPDQATTLGARGLTPGYAPLEQYGQGRTDARTDVYALGATLYTLVTNGKRPPDVLQRLQNPHDPLVPPSQLNHEVTSDTEKVILKSMEITTDRRYQTIDDFVTELVQANTTTVVSPPPPPDPDSGNRLPRKVAIIAAAMLVLLLGSVGALWWGSGGLPVSPTAIPIPAIQEAIIAIDDQTLDAGDDFQQVDCDTSRRIEVTFLDAAGNPVEAANFSYNWRFEPDDPHNDDKTNSSNYVTNYHVPCELNNQTVIIEAQKDGKTFFTKSLLFDIEQ